jgi:hypothetical protein
MHRVGSQIHFYFKFSKGMSVPIGNIGMSVARSNRPVGCGCNVLYFGGGVRPVDENAKRSQAGALCEPAAAPANARPASCPRRCPLRPPKTFQATKTFQDTNTARACGSMQPHLDLAPGSRAKKIWSTISLLIAATGFCQVDFLSVRSR